MVSVVPAVLQPHARSLGFSEGCVVHEQLFVVLVRAVRSGRTCIYHQLGDIRSCLEKMTLLRPLVPRDDSLQEPLGALCFGSRVVPS